MTISRWFICCLIAIAGCSKPTGTAVVPGFPSPTGPYSATAMLNETTWFGTAFARREYVEVGKPCTIDQFSLGISTDIPHAQSGSGPFGGVTGCIGRCMPTQMLGIQRIPLRTGLYKLSELQTCLEGNNRAAGEYWLISGGDVIIDSFYPPGLTLQQGQQLVSIPGSDDSWLSITRYDPASEQIEGSFELRLKNIQGQEARFTKGAFRVKLSR